MSQATRRDQLQQQADNDRLSFEVLTNKNSINNIHTGRLTTAKTTTKSISNHSRIRKSSLISRMIQKSLSLSSAAAAAATVEKEVTITKYLQQRRRSRDMILLNYRPVILLCLLIISIVSIHLNCHVNASSVTDLNPASGVDTRAMAKVSKAVANKLQSSGARFVKKLDLAKSSGQINDWLVHQVAPAMATKVIDNILQAPAKSRTKKSKSILEFDSNSKSTHIDTQALADKIVDKLADGIKKRKNIAPSSSNLQTTSGNEESADNDNQVAGSNQVISSSSTSISPDSNSATEERSAKGSNRRGKSLVSDSVHQVVQNLFARDNRKFFGRAMEKSKLPLRSAIQSLHNSSSSSNSWLMVKEPLYDQHLFVSTDSSQLDENPVVLRAEHGHNSTTVSPPQQQNYQNQRQELHHQQNISPLISSLMSNPSTNQMGNKLLQKHRLQQKYVHTNRHQQQHLSPKPWPPSSSSSSLNNGQQHNRRHQQQSPYSLPVTSDMNIVSAPSSPAPPPIITMPPSTTMASTTSTTTSTTPNPPPATFSFVPPTQTTNNQVGPIKFKFNNRHSQYPASSVSPLGNTVSAQSWYSTNRNPYNHPNSNHRFQHHHPSTTSTTSTTTTTTTTTTTPEPPPPQTEPALVDAMDSLLDIDQQTSSPVSSILSSVAQSAIDSLSQSNSFGNTGSNHSPSSSSSTIHEDYTSYQNNSSYSSPNSSGPSHGSIKGASPSTTSARHSVISAEAIPTALGAPLYHLTRANFTATSIMAPPPRRSGTSPAAKVAVQYFQKGLNNMASTIFGRQSKNWAKRLGISSVLLSGLLYGAAILANPGAPLPTNGFEVLQALTKNKRRRGARESLISPLADSNGLNKFAAPITGPLNTALLDNNVNILYQQPQLIPILEHLIQQEQLQQQQNSLFSQRSYGASPIEIENIEPDQMVRRAGTSQYYTLQAMPENYHPETKGNYEKQFRIVNSQLVQRKRR